MLNDNLHEDQEFKPEDAFLYAMDEAIEITANCLRATGADEETIWQAFRKSLAFLVESTADIDPSKQTIAPDAVSSSFQKNFSSIVQSARMRRQTERKAAEQMIYTGRASKGYYHRGD